MVCAKEEFFRILDETDLPIEDKAKLKFSADYFLEGHEKSMLNKSFIICGMPGVGKTYLASKFINAIGKEVVFYGCRKNKESCSSFQEMLDKISNDKCQIAFIDDLNYLLANYECEDDIERRRAFVSIVETVVENPNKVLIITAEDIYDVDRGVRDRIEAKIHLVAPNEVQKKNFLLSYGKFMKEEEIDYASHNTLGYAYRDLCHLVKLGYHLGNGSISLDFLKEAISKYTPSPYYGMKIYNGVKESLKDVIGKKEALRIAKRITYLCKHEGVDEALCIQRSNLLIFHGPPGTGKSFMVKALAGEVGYPIITVSATDMYRGSVIGNIENQISLAKRFKRCILFIDEAEKLIGNPSLGDDGVPIGALNAALESIDDSKTNAIFILAVNDINRFGGASLDRFVKVEFGLPSFDERLVFLDGKLAKSGHKFNIDSGVIARVTDNMSFREIDRMWNELMFLFIEGKPCFTESIAYGIANKFRNSQRNELCY